MITIAKRVEQIIERWPMLKQGLELDLLNTSSVARYLKPGVEKEIGERISEAAVLMAIRRYQKKDRSTWSVQPKDFLGDMSLRSNLVDLTFANSPTLQKKLDELTQELQQDHYLTISRGLLQTSVILHKDHLKSTKAKLKNEHLQVQSSNLTAITLHLKKGHDNVTGILAYPLQLLAWRGITVVELVSTYDELNIVLYDKEVEQAFTTINSALKSGEAND